MAKRKTIFLDIDGTIFRHHGDQSPLLVKPILLPGVLDKLHEWLSQDYCVVLTTARHESIRKFTEDQLQNSGIEYDQLIMGIGSGERIIINDGKPSDEGSCRAYAVIRDMGLTNVNI